MRAYTDGELRSSKALLAIQIRSRVRRWQYEHFASVEFEQMVSSNVERAHRVLEKLGHHPATTHDLCELWARKRACAD